MRKPARPAAASTAQILDRLYRNPCGLLNEQPYLDTLMSARNAENSRRQTRHLVIAVYVLAFSSAVLAFKTPQAPAPAPPDQAAEQRRAAETALESAVSALKEEFNLKLQNKELEIKDLKRQVSLLNQSQAELSKRVKSLPKPQAPAAKPAAAKPAPPAVDKPRKPN